MSQKITPFLWFDGQAEEAAAFYTSIFKNSRVLKKIPYSESAEQASGRKRGTVMTVVFELDGQKYIALNGGPHYKFTEAVSFAVSCDTQEELDEIWEKLSAGGDPQAQQCGWLKDRFGLSWQVVPSILGELLGNPEKSDKAMAAVLQMKKIDIEKLKAV